MECPVCLTLPEGEVHQCLEGHCYCAECWNRLEEPRRCPECRQPVPQANRNRAIERTIAALEWSCEHCGEAMTRGAKAAHLAACPQLPTACAAAVAGCGWAGMLSEQAAHEVACPFAICQRMMAPLQAQNLQLQSTCQEQQSQNQQLQARCDGLQRQVAALQPLAGRVRALEGVETEEGGRRQRQRVGPAPRDMPPSDDVIAEMGLAEAVAALRAHVAVARVAEKACERLVALCRPLGTEQASVEAGVIEAVVEALRAHPQVSFVQGSGLSVLHYLCIGADAAARARAQRAMRAGFIEAAVAAIRAEAQELGGMAAPVQQLGCMALAAVCEGDDAAGRARKQRAAEAGALEAVVEAMRAMQAHLQVRGGDVLQIYGCRALVSVCGGGASAAARARRQRAAQAGGRTVAAAAMQAYPDNVNLQGAGQLVLNALPA